MEIIQPAYDSSAYKLKYRVTFTSLAGYLVRMGVYVKSSVMMIVKEIGEFRSLSLSLDGNGEIDDPITKSTLQFSMVDDIYKEGGSSIKYGNWQEFFAPDSTAYLIKVETDEGAGFETRWSGYVTPDSWEEDLGAYGDIRVTARDNIGHLADFEFDLDGSDSGTVSVRTLLTEAMKKVAMPMSLVLNTDSKDEAMGVYGGDLNILEAAVNVAAFEGKSWYDAVSEVLGSLGLTMRYTDNNAVTVMPLANLPLLADTQSLTPYEVKFLDGTRMLAPAYKEIVSETDYGMQDEFDLDVRAGLTFDGSAGTYDSIYHWNDQDVISTGVYNSIAGADNGWQADSAMFNPDAYEVGGDLLKYEGETAKDYVFLIANQNPVSKSQAFSWLMNAPELEITIGMVNMPVTISYEDGKLTRYGEAAYLSRMSFVLTSERNGIVKYWNGSEWQDSLEVMYMAFEKDISLMKDVILKVGSLEGTGTAKYTLYFNDIFYEGYISGKGVYARLQSLKLKSTAVQLESDKVRTVNNESYNIKADRSLDFGALSKQVAYVNPQSYMNALWDMTAQDEVSQFPYYCFLESDFYTGREEFPLPVLIHRQMLMYHHVAQPVISGECASSDARPLGFDRLYRYKGVDHIIQGGTLNLRTGRMEGVTLRGFVAYDELWG